MVSHDLRRDDRLAIVLLAALPIIHGTVTAWFPDPYRWFSVQALYLPAIVMAALASYCLFDRERLTAFVASIPAWSKYAMAGVLVIAFASVLAIDVGLQRSATRTLICLVAFSFGLIVASRLETPGLRTGLVNAILIGATLYLPGLALYVLLQDGSPDVGWLRLGYGVTNVRQTGFFTVLGAGMALATFAIASDRRQRWISFGVTVLMVAAIYWAGIRGGVLAFVAAGAVVILMYGRVVIVRVAAGVLGALALAAPISFIGVPDHPSYGFLRIFSRSVGAPPAGEMTNGRWEMWTEAVSMATQSPWIGHGAGRYILLADQSLGKFNHPHNALVQIAFDWGFVALGLVLVLVLFGLIGRFRDIRDDVTLAPPMAGLVALLAYSMVEGSFYHGYPLLMIAALTAILLAPSPSGSRAETCRQNPA